MELVIILIAIAVVVVAGLGTTFLVLPRRRRVSAPPRPPVAGPEAKTTEAPPAQEERGPPGETLPRAPDPAVRGPTLREPAPSPLRGRLTRLRGRPAASRGGFGSAPRSPLAPAAPDH